jgi:TatD DNase family protein
LLRLFDSHCHLDLPALADNWQQHWQQAQAVGVQACLLPAVSAAHWPKLLELCQQPQFFAALGVHPWWAANAILDDLTTLETLLAEKEEVCAVGEIGLDFALDAATFSAQQALFSAQLAIAKRFEKPIILHHRKSQPQLLAELKRQQFHYGGILHAFSGSYAQAKAFVDLGFKLGIGGTITYERAHKTQNTVKKLPLDSLVLETDAPAMPLAGHQGQINTPAQLAEVFQCLLALRSESAQLLQEALWQNTLAALNLSKAVLGSDLG